MKKTAARQVAVACEKLLSEEGEASGTSRTQQALALYAALDAPHRLQSDRRCCVFFHPDMPCEPRIFVEVALVDAMAARTGPLLDSEAAAGDAEPFKTAVFYSISNCQLGLYSIALGNFLLKRVVDQLYQEFPRVNVSGALKGKRARKDVNRKCNQPAVVWQPHQPI